MIQVKTILFFTVGLFFFLQGCESTTPSTPASDTTQESTQKVFTAGDDQQILQDDDLFLEASILDRSKTFKSYQWKENGVILAKTRTFNPKGLSVGTHKLTIEAEDSQGTTYTDTITITIKPNDTNNTRPTAESFTLSLKEDTKIQTYLRGGDSDGDALHYVLVGYPEHGTLSGSYARLTYTPDANFYGQDHFSFKTNDGKIDSNLATVTIMIESVNDAPVWHTHPLTKIDEDAYYYHEFNATDADGDSITISASDNMPAWLTLEDNGTLHGTPTNDDILSRFPTITFTADDGKGGRSTNAFAIQVVNTNDAPIAQNDFNQTTEDQNITFNVLANDTDVDANHTLTLIDANVTKGAIMIDANGSITFDPHGAFDSLLDQNETATIFYRIQDEHNATSEANVTLTIIGENTPPTIVENQAIMMDETGTQIKDFITISDIDSQPTFSLPSDQNNTFFQVDSTGSYTFTPSAHFFDSLAEGETSTLHYDILINDGDFQKRHPINITVHGKNSAPRATDDTSTLAQNTTITLDVLANDSDIDHNDSLSITQVDTPQKGNVTIQNNRLIFATNHDFDTLRQGESETISFDYTISDGNLSDTATLQMTILGKDDQPSLIITGPLQILQSEDANFSTHITSIDHDATYTYEWYQDDQLLNETAANISLQNLPIGTYTIRLKATDTQSQLATETSTILQVLANPTIFNPVTSFKTPSVFQNSDGQDQEYGVYSIDTADFNGDGKIDILTNSALSITWYENQGKGQSFIEHIVTPHPDTTGIRFVRAADLDGDIRPDILAMNKSISASINQGDGTMGDFSLAYSGFLGDDEIFSLTLFDVEEDDKLEILTTADSEDTVNIFQYSNNELTWLDNLSQKIEGSNSSFQPSYLPSANAIDTIVNKSGTRELVTAGYEGDLHFFDITSQDPFKQTFDTKLNYPISYVHFADLDGDTDSDLVLVSDTDTSGTLLWRKGSDQTMQTIYTNNNKAIQDPTIIDIDNDGDTDIVIAVDRKVILFENDGATTPSFTQKILLTHTDVIQYIKSAKLYQDDKFVLLIGDDAGYITIKEQQ